MEGITHDPISMNRVPNASIISKIIVELATITVHSDGVNFFQNTN